MLGADICGRRVEGDGGKYGHWVTLSSLVTETILERFA